MDVQNAKQKLSKSLTDIKVNFKPDDGALGAKKIQSMFVNLWKSGGRGRQTWRESSFIALILLSLVFSGCGRDQQTGNGDSPSKKHSAAPDTLVVKGFYMRQSGDEALKACEKLAASSKDLVVVDFRNGIEHEKDEATKAAEKKEYEKAIVLAKKDVESFFKWYNYNGEGFDLYGDGFIKDKGKGNFVGDVALPSTGTDSLIRGVTRVNFAVFKLAAHFNYQVEWMLPVKQVVKSDEPPKPLIGKCSSSEVSWHKVYSKYLKDKLVDQKLDAVKEKDGWEIIWFRLLPRDEQGNPVSKDELFKKYISRFPERSPWADRAKKKFRPCLKGWLQFRGNAYALNAPNGVLDLVTRGKIVDGADIETFTTIAKVGNLQVEWMVPVRPSGLQFETGTLTVPKKDQEIADFQYKTMTNVDSERSYFYGKMKEKELEIPHGSEVWCRLAPKDTNGVDVVKEDIVKSWLIARGHQPPSDKKIIAKKNLIEVAVKEDGKDENDWKGLCNVWIDEAGNVSEVFFTEEGMARFFNAEDLSSKEFTQALVKNYPDIPRLDVNVKTDSENDDGSMTLRTYTWIYKDPRGFQVKVLDSAFYNGKGQRINMKGLSGVPNEAGIAAGILSRKEKKWFAITAIKPELERKFD